MNPGISSDRYQRVQKCEFSSKFRKFSIFWSFFSQNCIHTGLNVNTKSDDYLFLLFSIPFDFLLFSGCLGTFKLGSELRNPLAYRASNVAPSGTSTCAIILHGTSPRLPPLIAPQRNDILLSENDLDILKMSSVSLKLTLKNPSSSFSPQTLITCPSRKLNST